MAAVENISFHQLDIALSCRKLNLKRFLTILQRQVIADQAERRSMIGEITTIQARFSLIHMLSAGINQDHIANIFLFFFRRT